MTPAGIGATAGTEIRRLPGAGFAGFSVQARGGWRTLAPPGGAAFLAGRPGRGHRWPNFSGGETSKRSVPGTLGFQRKPPAKGGPAPLPTGASFHPQAGCALIEPGWPSHPKSCAGASMTMPNPGDPGTFLAQRGRSWSSIAATPIARAHSGKPCGRFFPVCRR